VETLPGDREWIGGGFNTPVFGWVSLFSRESSETGAGDIAGLVVVEKGNPGTAKSPKSG
jgi:hypothetical protein